MIGSNQGNSFDQNSANDSGPPCWLSEEAIICLECNLEIYKPSENVQDIFSPENWKRKEMLSMNMRY